MPQPSPQSDAAPASPLERALDQNTTVKETVEQSSAELAVINAVLEVGLPGDVKKGDIAQALLKTDELETKIQDTAQDLAEVNEVLAQEIDARVELEQDLADVTQVLAQEIDARMDLEGEVATIKADLAREKAKR